jgi:cytochrome b
VWDLPTRLFHWALVVLVVFSVATAKMGGNAMDWHFLSGFTILTLMIFRLLWGFAGDRYARFGQFVRGPRAMLAYLGGKADSFPGHNPLGAWSVIALLAALTFQAGSGLFANDSIATEGPLAKLVSSAASDRATALHNINEKVIYLLVGMHLAAILFYLLRRRENLVRPMITGDKPIGAIEPAADDAGIRRRALILFAVAAALVNYVVGL